MRTEEKTLIITGKAPELKNLTRIKNLDLKKSLPKLVRIDCFKTKCRSYGTLNYGLHITTNKYTVRAKIHVIIFIFKLNQHKLCFKAKSTRPTLFFISNLTKTESL